MPDPVGVHPASSIQAVKREYSASAKMARRSRTSAVRSSGAPDSRCRPTVPASVPSLEVVVHGRVADADGARDALDADCVGTADSQQFLGGIEHLLTSRRSRPAYPLAWLHLGHRVCVSY
jgi:hypothetical protein